MAVINNIRLNVGESDEQLKSKASKLSKIPINKVKHFKILKKSLDARRKNDIHYVCSVEICDTLPKHQEITNDKYSTNTNIVIIGSGPAGLFSALIFARKGFKPIVIERGSDVDRRREIIDDFIATRKLDVETNIQFGEGGAGAFSDGKLNTGIKSEYKQFVLDEFVSHGASPEIAYINKPHVGSDVLPIVVKNIRNEIIKLGGKFIFNANFNKIITKDDKIIEITYTQNGKNHTLNVDELIVAIGHSSRDTYKMLYSNGVFMEQKDTAIGFRIEHLQDDINVSQYGENYDKRLPVADYKLTSNVTERGVFTFCMCPGGFVMPATSTENAVVTNGMSNFARDGKNANSALIVQIKKDDYGTDDILKTLDFIENFEKKAFEIAGGDYSAPCQLVGDFLKRRISVCFGKVVPTYPLKTKFVDLHNFFSEDIYDCFKKSLIDMNNRLKGFASDDAVLTAVETRTSSPIRIVRGEDFASVSHKNLFPVGEVGYAGGIMSSAIDGIRVANTIIEKYKI